MLVGHDTAVNLFKRLAKTDQLASGYIFFGQAQVGKRTFAESLGHYLEGRDFAPSSHILQETLSIKPQGGSIGIETSRQIKTYLSATPIASSKRMVIIDDAQSLTPQAENALLKISEEAPKNALLIFIANSAEAILRTLGSRLQKIYFPPVAEKELEKIIPRSVSDKDKKELLLRASGSAGRLIELLGKNDALHDLAKKIATASAATRKELLKKYLEDEESPLALLDALLLLFFSADKKDTMKIQKTLKVKRELATLNLNPRLQLESIFS